MSVEALQVVATLLSAVSIVSSLAMFVVSLMIARQIADLKAYVHQNFVAKKDFMDMIELLAVPDKRARQHG